MVPPITVWYNLTFPVAAEDVIRGAATESTIITNSIILIKVTVHSGTVVNHNCNNIFVSRKIGKEIIMRRKNVYLEHLYTKSCIVFNSSMA